MAVKLGRCVRHATHVFTVPPEAEWSELVKRAKAAWFGTGEHGTPDDTSGFKMREGLGYVVLRQRSFVLGVYQVRSDNLMLRRMKRPPKGLA